MVKNGCWINVSFSNDDLETRILKKDYDLKLIKVLNKFISICQDNNLRYVLGYGSVLGAIRHNGIIPWDDDIDVCMPRPDYERFIDICLQMDDGEYEAYIINETDGYNEPYIKFADKRTSLLYHRRTPYVCGVMIDIFPMDGATDIDNEWKKDSDKYNRYHYLHQGFITLTHRLESIKSKGKRYAFISLFITPIRSFLLSWIWKRMQMIEQKYSYDESGYVAFYHRVYGYKDRIPKKWIEETMLHKFESIEARIPQEYDDYLKYFYDDYMQIPPIEERDKHKIVYLNLDERESIDMILNKIKNETTR